MVISVVFIWLILTLQRAEVSTGYTWPSRSNLHFLTSDIRALWRSALSARKSEGKEEHLYSTILADTTLTKRSDMDHTVLPANYTMSAFPECQNKNIFNISNIYNTMFCDVCIANTCHKTSTVPNHWFHFLNTKNMYILFLNVRN